MVDTTLRTAPIAQAGRLLTLVVIAFLVGSCAEPTAPTRARVSDNPHKSLQITDWYSCWRRESSPTWEGCEYMGSTSMYIAGWADFPRPELPTSLTEVKVTNSTFPSCPDEPAQDLGPHLYDPAPDADDMTQRAGRPDCRYTQILDNRDKAWCKAGMPQYSRKSRIADALQRMAELGGVCADLAATGQSLLAEGAIRVYNPDPNPEIGYQGGGFGSVNLGARGYILLHKNWTDGFWRQDTYGNQTTKLPDGTAVNFKTNLQFALAHEIEHLTSSADHIDPQASGGGAWLTAHSIECSGLH